MHLKRCDKVAYCDRLAVPINIYLYVYLNMAVTSINDLPCFDGGKHLEGFREKLHICV